MADTGWNVLDANVETTSLVLKKNKTHYNGVFIDLQESDGKDNELKCVIDQLAQNIKSNIVHLADSISFNNLPNSIIGYYFNPWILKLFNNFKPLAKNGFYAMYGSNIPPDQYLRLFWENNTNGNHANLQVIFYNGGGSYSLFYNNFRETVFFGETGSFVKFHKSSNLRNLEATFKKSIGYGKRGEILDSHILPQNVLFSAEGHAFRIENFTNTTGLELLSFMNSIFSQYVINLYCGQHKTNGYINLIPFSADSSKFENDILQKITEIINIKLRWYSLDETCLEFRHLLTSFTSAISLKDSISRLQIKLNHDKERYKIFVEENDLFWLKQTCVPVDSYEIFEKYKSKRPSENLISIDGITDSSIADNPYLSFEIISNIIGISFGRWDIRSIINPECTTDLFDPFEPLPSTPIVSLESIPFDYPIQIPTNGILVGNHSDSHSLLKAINDVICKIWPASSDKITNELIEIGKIDSLEQFISNPNGFFDFHYKRYTKSRREAPIYWPISTSSGRYTVWLYYPKMNDQTLFKVVNDFILPKQQEVAEQIKKLENNPNLDNKGKKELLDNQNLFHELKAMGKDLLEVAALPYKPNHDDGVLITASPLYKFFRHSKWKKSTEECWKALQKGEYDWAHLAYSIWPERVTHKCKKDLSMAIAHGLEEICEIKPKEKKEKKVAKSTNKNIQGKLID
jgi:hypothetical protein